MFSSRMLIALLIPAIILGLTAWLASSTDINRSEVKVAGELLGGTEVSFEVKGCSFSEEQGARVLSVALEAHNTEDFEVSIKPLLFQLILLSGDDPLSTTSHRGVYQPLRFTSTCPEAPESVSRIPPHATRSITLAFWGGNLPHGAEWDEHLLSLEYYDPATSVIASKLFSPPE